MSNRSILVFTSRPIESMLADGGSRAWALDARRARECTYLVCAWNSTGEYSRGNDGRQRGEAFLVAPITAVEPDYEIPSRYIVRFQEFATVSVLNAWSGQRNPIFYTTLEDLGVSPAELAFSTVPPVEGRPTISTVSPLLSDPGRLTIAAAKSGLAANYGVPVDAIEIVIRG